MRLEKRINWKKHSLLCAIPFIASIFIVGGMRGFFGMLTAYLATMINQWMLVEAVDYITDPDGAGAVSERKKQAATLLFLKLFVLFGGLSLSVLFIGKWVIIAVINYVISIFLLVTTSKKG